MFVFAHRLVWLEVEAVRQQLSSMGALLDLCSGMLRKKHFTVHHCPRLLIEVVDALSLET